MPALPCINFGHSVIFKEAQALYRCPDGHFHHVNFILGPFIADYPEQVMLSGVLQNWCPRYVHISQSGSVLCPQCKMLMIAVPHFQWIFMAQLDLKQMH
jgi:hypothetical protein